MEWFDNHHESSGWKFVVARFEVGPVIVETRQLVGGRGMLTLDERIGRATTCRKMTPN